MSEAVVPRGWTTVALAEIAEVRLGRQRSPKRAIGPHMQPYLRAANVTWQGIDLKDIKEMDFTPAECEIYALRNGDILLSEASGSPLEVGKPAIWRAELPLCCFQNTLIRVRPKDLALTRFLHLHFTKDALTGRFAEASRGVGIHHLGAGTIVEWSILLPPHVEQTRIVEATDSYFSRLDDTMATLERVQRNLKRYRASVLKAAVEGRLVPTEAELARAEKRDYEPASELLKRILAERRRRWDRKGKYEEPVAPDTSNLPDLPEGWCWTTLGQLKEFSLYGPRFSSEDYVPEGKLVLRTSDISPSGKVNLATAPRISLSANDFAKFKVEVGDLLITRTGSLGTLAVFNDDIQAIPGAYLIQFRLAAPLETSWFCFHMFKSPSGQEQLKGGGAGVGRPNLNAPTIESIVFGLPPIAEQIRIIRELDRILSVSDELEAQIQRELARCTRLRQSILKWAFEGKLVDQDPNDEPASALLERIRAQKTARTK